ncbi:MAG: formylglycine-generating enzyme family protein [Anaerolineae bacterium]|nr:formylglycine-generating enzyme family protein [Anaerolineae bacterium]
MLLPALCPVPGGTYPLGSDALPAARPAHTVMLAAYSLAQTAVTNAEYAQFVAAGGYRQPRWWTDAGRRWLKTQPGTFPAFWHDARFNQAQQPVVGISWYEALAYATWLAHSTGAPWRLPAEAEYEAAARGHGHGHDHGQPGHAPQDDRRIISAAGGPGHPVPVTTPGDVSWCGAYHLHGNVRHWCSTRYGRNWQTALYHYPYRADDGREDLTGSFARILRGGSWFDAPAEAHPAQRARYLPGLRGSNIGFRLAYSGHP